MPQGEPASSTRKRGRRKARDSTCYFEILPDDLVLAILGKLRYPRVVTRAEASCTRFRRALQADNAVWCHLLQHQAAVGYAGVELAPPEGST